MPDLAPIAIFAYNRPRHLERLISSLESCEELSGSELWLFCDGPSTRGDESLVAEVAGISDRLTSRYHCKIVRQPRNRGLAASIVEGVSMLAARYGRIIVLEDDLVVSRGFLRYMNDALAEFAPHDRVLQVSGHSFSADGYRGSDSASFLPMVTTLGWGTWGRAWANYGKTPLDMVPLDSDRTLRRKFDLDGAYPYYRTLSRLRRTDRLGNSWGLRWYWTLFSRSGLSLFPHRTLVRHLGEDGTGTNCRAGGREGRDDFSDENRVGWLPREIAPDLAYFAAVKKRLAADQNPVRKAIRYARSTPLLLRRWAQ